MQEIKGKGGRPPKKPSDRYSAAVYVRLMPAQRERLFKEARASNTPPSVFARRLICEGLK
mgnify:CR=1 FL=1